MIQVAKGPLVIVRTQDQSLIHLYDGMPVPANADPADVERLAALGFVAGGPEVVPAEESEQPAKPAGNGSKEEWAAYAVQSGQATEDEIVGLTRDELRGLYS